jgi:N-acetylglucosamine-6-phosphate deacetylase
VAGSVARFDACFRRYARVTGLPLAEAIKATGWNQCLSLGIPGRGKVEPGFVADLVVLTADLQPVTTYVNGIKAGS